MWKSVLRPLSLVLAMAAGALAQDVDALRTQLSSASAARRAEAARLLGDAGDAGRSAVPDLLDALTDWNVRVRRAALTAIGEIGTTNDDVIDGLRRVAESRRDDEAILAVTAIARLGEASLPTITTLLGDVDLRDRVRKGLVAAGADAIPVVLALSDAKRWRIRIEAASLLGFVGESDAAAIARLSALATGDPIELVRVSALTALSRIVTTTDEVRSALRTVLRGKDEISRLVALEAFLTNGVPEADRREALVIAISDKSARVRLYAVRAAHQREIGGDLLVAALHDVDAAVVVEAARALLLAGDFTAVAEVADSAALRDVPAAAIAAVRAGRPAAGTADLLAAAALRGHRDEWLDRMEDVDRRVRSEFTFRRNLLAGRRRGDPRVPTLPAVPAPDLDAILDALGTLGRPAWESVSAYLGDGDEVVRALAAFVIGGMGADAVAIAVTPLSAMLLSENTELRYPAAIALAARPEHARAVVPILIEGAVSTNGPDWRDPVIRGASAHVRVDMWRYLTRPALREVLARLYALDVANPDVRKALFRLSELEDADSGTSALVERARELLRD